MCCSNSQWRMTIIYFNGLVCCGKLTNQNAVSGTYTVRFSVNIVNIDMVNYNGNNLPGDIRNILPSTYCSGLIRAQRKCALGGTPGARLTKAYDVTIQRYRNSHAKIEDSKMHILRCMGSKFCVKFQRCPLKFNTKFWTHTPQNMHFRGVKNLTTFNILELWHVMS